MEKYYDLELYGEKFKVKVELDKYDFSNSLCVYLTCDNGEPFAQLTVELCNDMAEEDYAFVDTNNCPWAREFLEKNNIAYSMGISVASGWCDYVLFRFNMKEIKGE